MNDKDSKDTITEGENLEEDEEEEEGGAETEEQSGNESEVNEPEEEVNSMIYLVLCISKKKSPEWYRKWPNPNSRSVCNTVPHSSVWSYT